MKRWATSPDGEHYVVAIDWFGRRLRNPLDTGRRRSLRVWRANPVVRLFGGGKDRQQPQPADQAVRPAAARAGADASKRRKGKWYDSCDCGSCDLDGDLVLPLLVVAAVLLAALALIVGAARGGGALGAARVLLPRARCGRRARVAGGRPTAVAAGGGRAQRSHVVQRGGRLAGGAGRGAPGRFGAVGGTAPAALGLSVIDRPGSPWLRNEEPGPAAD
ncbi:MAG: hypothetical protein R2755_17415 [Acidimicrobiales bacterium]